MISRSNYEIYFVDYFDGNLDERVKAELFTFLDANPDLKEEFEQFEQITTLPESNISFKNKESLKKETPTLLNYKTWLVAEMENDLSPKQVAQLNEFIRKNPSLEEERMKMQEVKLVADEINFPDKKKLRKPVIIPFKIISRRTVSVAAAIAIFILGFLFIYESNKDEKFIVHEKKETSAPENKQNIADNQGVNKEDATDNLKNNQEKGSVHEKDSKSQHDYSPDKPKRNIQSPVADQPLLTENANNSKNSPVEKTDLKDSTENFQPQSPITNPEPEPLAAAPKDKKQNTSIGLSDVFDESDYKDFHLNPKDEGTPVETIALKGVEKITGIAVEKSETENSTVYAFSVRKLFAPSGSRR